MGARGHASRARVEPAAARLAGCRPGTGDATAATEYDAQRDGEMTPVIV